MTLSRYSMLQPEENLNPRVLEAFDAQDVKVLGDELARAESLNPHEMLTYVVKAGETLWHDGLEAILHAWGFNAKEVTLQKGVRAGLLQVALEILGHEAGQIKGTLEHAAERVLRAERSFMSDHNLSKAARPQVRPAQAA
jgi:hypothetical protein